MTAAPARPAARKTAYNAMSGLFMKIGGTVYGPYRAERVRAFLGEGRVTARTPAACAPTGPFVPLEQVFPVRAADARPASELARLIVCGRFGVAGAAIVEDALLSMGVLVEAAPSVWLLEARVSAAEVRNSLSRRLGRDDAFVVARVDGRDAAWFNVGAEADAALRAALARDFKLEDVVSQLGA